MQVICKQLGYNFANAFPTPVFGQSISSAALYRLNCAGNENSLRDCSYSVVTNQFGCTHQRDLTLACAGSLSK